MTSDQRQALENFSVHLTPGARVLYASARSAASPEEAQTPIWLRSHGFDVEEIDSSKDLRFLSLKRESYAAVWSGRAWVDYSIEDAQRIIAIFFQALLPRTGILFAAFLEGAGPNTGTVTGNGIEDEAPPLESKLHRYAESGFSSMIRQNGFQLLLQGRQEQNGGWCAVIARRV